MFNINSLVKKADITFDKLELIIANREEENLKKMVASELDLKINPLLKSIREMIVSDEVKVELKKNSIYSRVYFLLYQLEGILKKPDSQMIIDYEYIRKNNKQHTYHRRRTKEITSNLRIGR